MPLNIKHFKIIWSIVCMWFAAILAMMLFVYAFRAIDCYYKNTRLRLTTEYLGSHVTPDGRTDKTKIAKLFLVTSFEQF